MYCSYCGKEINEKGDVCIGCGRSVIKAKASQNDSSSAGWWWLGFFFPLIGFILWLVWMGDTPIRSRKAGWGALIGVVVSIALVVLLYIALFVFAFIVGANLSSGIYL